MAYQACESFAMNHPKGGRLVVRALTPISAEFIDTRRLDGKKRILRGVVYQCGRQGWKVVHNPGPDHKVAGFADTATAVGAWEVCLPPREFPIRSDSRDLSAVPFGC